MGAAPEHAWVPRTGLAERVVVALSRGCLVVTAPAGFGKTTLLEQALQRSGAATAWVRCTPGTRDGGQLVTRLVASIQAAVPGAADALAERLGSTQEQVDAVSAVEVLVAELDRLLIDPITAVFDDAEHLAGVPDAEVLLGALLSGAGGMLRVAVASRRPLGLSRCPTLGAADLAFTADECAAYLAAATGRHPAADEVDVLFDTTEGWPLAVATLVRARERLSRPPRAPLRSPDGLRAFLAEEVLGTLDHADRLLVLDSAVPRVLSPSTVAALGLPERFVDDLRAKGLFLRPVEEGGLAYHPLFRDVLLERLRIERDGDHVAALHQRVAPVVATQGLAVDAVEHWMAARDWPAVIAAMTAEARTLAGTSPSLVRGWVDRLPADVRAAPVVRLLEGQLEWGAGNYSAATTLLRAALAGDGLATDPGSAWWARFLLADSLSVTGDLKGAVAVAEGFNRPEARPGGILAAATGLYAAHCLAALGRDEDAERLASAVRHLPEKEVLAPVDIQLRAYLHVPAGRHEEALDQSTAALRLLDGGDPLLLRFNVMTTIALVLADQGRIEEALGWWQRIAADATASLLTAKARAAHAFCAMHLAQLGRLADAHAELAAYEPVATWVGWSHHIARAMVASGRGESGAALTAVREAFDAVRPAALQYRFWTAVLLVPVLVRSGVEEWAGRVVKEMTGRVDDVFPGGRGRFMRARLVALDAWLAFCRGDTAAGVDGAARSVTEAGDAAAQLLRLEWERIEPLVIAAAADDALDPSAVADAVARAFPDGAPLVPLIEHPDPDIRRASLVPALASGHPAAAAAVARRRSDSDRSVAAAAREALDGLVTSPPPLTFSTLGGFGVRRGGWRVDERSWGRPVDARLVRYLLVHRDRSVREADLFDAFWRGAPRERARRSLQVAVSRVRSVLDHPGDMASLIEVSDGAYRLRLGPADVVDWERFEAAARAALADVQLSRPALEHARSLWGGEPLPRERYSDWAAAWRTRLTERYMEVLSALVECSQRDGDHGAAIVAAREMVELDSLNEVAHRELIAAYARAGRRGQALRQYLECRRALVDELGVEPGSATARLHAAVLSGEEV